MSSMLDCWNDALRILGMTRVSSTNPTNEAARALNDAWRQTVLRCLEVGDWDFAKRRAALARVLPAPAFGWLHYYALPADAARLVFVSETGLPDDRLLRYAREDGKIAADAETVYAIWITSAVVDLPGTWSESFARFVAASLAQACLKLNPGAKDDVADALKRAKPAAEGVDAVGNPPAIRRPGRWASSIRGYDRSREQG